MTSWASVFFSWIKSGGFSLAYNRFDWFPTRISFVIQNHWTVTFLCKLPFLAAFIVTAVLFFNNRKLFFGSLTQIVHVNDGAKKPTIFYFPPPPQFLFHSFSSTIFISLVLLLHNCISPPPQPPPPQFYSSPAPPQFYCFRHHYNSILFTITTTTILLLVEVKMVKKI